MMACILESEGPGPARPGLGADRHRRLDPVPPRQFWQSGNRYLVLEASIVRLLKVVVVGSHRFRYRQCMVLHSCRRLCDMLLASTCLFKEPRV